MPQASDELRAQWPGGDGEALEYLQSISVFHDRGVFRNVPDDLPPKAWSAINYLCDEWDFAVEALPTPAGRE